MKVSVHHWRYEDGWRDIPPILVKPGEATREFSEEHVGWFCWVYADEEEFEEWMKKNMLHSYDLTWRFNSGDPMMTLWIENDEDAALFKLRFV